MAQKRRDYTVGSALYEETKYYCNQSLLINPDDQMLIKKYNYAKLSHTPPYPSIDQTPAVFIDAFQIIEEEASFTDAS